MNGAKAALFGAAIAAGGALAGCASTQDAMSAPPTLSYRAAAPLEQVRDCILKGSEGVKDYVSWPVPAPQVQARADLTRIVFLADPRVYVDLTPDGDGTSVRYVRLLRKMKPSSGYDDVVQACRTPS